MDDLTVRAALQRHWEASDANDFNVEHEIYREDAVLDYPQSGADPRPAQHSTEPVSLQPNKKRFTVRRIIGGVCGADAGSICCPGASHCSASADQ